MNTVDSQKEEVFQKKPVLKKLVQDYGDISLFEYAQKHYHGSKNVITERKEEFLNFIYHYTTSRFGDTMAHQVRDSLEKEYCVSTAEHHGPLGHAFFFQSAILRGLVQPGLPIIHFCASQVSLGNSSYPRGFLFHGEGTESRKETVTLPIFGSKHRMSPVYALPGYSRDVLEQYTMPHLESEAGQYLISPKQKRFLQSFIKTFLGNEKILSQNTYSKQITLLNSHLWAELFSGYLPPLLCLDAEDIAKELLLMLIEQKGVFHTIIFEGAIGGFIEKNFDTIACCFDIRNLHGTYLFWHLDENHMRHALWREGDTLKSSTNSYTIELHPDKISDGLKNNHIIPSGLLVYSLFHCYYGITCFGGFSQGTYLNQIQEAYTNLGYDPDGAKIGQNNPTNILCEDMVFHFGENQTMMTALDMLYKKDTLSYKKLLSEAKNQTIQNSLDAMIPEIARCL